MTGIEERIELQGMMEMLNLILIKLQDQFRAEDQEKTRIRNTVSVIMMMRTIQVWKEMEKIILEALTGTAVNIRDQDK